jgi:SAM-dependent methyltransferase
MRSNVTGRPSPAAAFAAFAAANGVAGPRPLPAAVCAPGPVAVPAPDPVTPEPMPSPVSATIDTEPLDWRDIPVFIVNRNRLEALRLLVDWLCAAGTRRVVILDNASDYPPLLEYYKALPAGVRLMLLPENLGPYVLWQQGVHEVLDTPYIVTDSDVVPADFCPPDLVAALLARLQRWPDAKKVGTALRIDNLPDSYGDVDTVRKWESQFWEHPVAPGVFAAPIDTTFALYPARGEFSNERSNLRLGHPYVAEHTPWYADEAALSVEERHYREHTSAAFSNWSVANKESWVKKSARVVAFERRARVLHLDGGREYIPGWINAGAGPGRFDLAFDPRRCREQPLPLADDSLDGIHLSHVLEEVRDAHALFAELWRVARPGAKLHLRVAHGARADAWQDPRQERAWHEGSFAHFAQPSLVPGAAAAYVADWQVESIGLVVSNGPATLQQVREGRGLAKELIVTLTAVKPGRPRAGLHPALQPDPRLLDDERVDPAFRVAAVPGLHRPPVDGARS